jgi:hypothetical protein
VPQKASYKSKGGKKDSAAKNTINPRGSGGGKHIESHTPGGQEQDPQRRIGQHGGMGEPELQKK